MSLNFHIYHSLPSSIEAMRVWKPFDAFRGMAHILEVRDNGMTVQTAGGPAVVYDGDWLAKEPDGRGYYPIKDEIFRQRWRI